MRTHPKTRRVLRRAAKLIRNGRANGSFFKDRHGKEINLKPGADILLVDDYPALREALESGRVARVCALGSVHAAAALEGVPGKNHPAVQQAMDRFERASVPERHDFSIIGWSDGNLSPKRTEEIASTLEAAAL